MVSDMAHQQTPRDAAPASPVAEAEAGDAPRALPPAAQRALAEAEERRRAAEAQNDVATKPAELGGRAGPDPVRYGDWEKGGIASDF